MASQSSVSFSESPQIIKPPEPKKKPLTPRQKVLIAAQVALGAFVIATAIATAVMASKSGLNFNAIGATEIGLSVAWGLSAVAIIFLSVSIPTDKAIMKKYNAEMKKIQDERNHSRCHHHYHRHDKHNRHTHKRAYPGQAMSDHISSMMAATKHSSSSDSE